MKKLINLIHLGLDRCRRLEEMPRGIGQLTSLEVLSRFSLSDKRRRDVTGGLDELHELSNLRGTLKMVNLQYVKKGVWEFEAANLKEKPHLRYLALEWGDDHVLEVEVDMSNEEKSLEALEPHANLKKLRLRYYGGVSLPRWVSSLKNLVKIKISTCINCKSLSPLDELPSLQRLDASALLELEYIMDNINENTKGGDRSCFFPSLKKLTLFGCPRLKGWCNKEEQLHYELPHLSKLNIWICPDFKGWMPLLPSLNTLNLSETSSELLEETLKHARPPSASTSASLSPLKSLTISSIVGLGFLREEALRGLTSLKFLQIWHLADTSFLALWIYHLSSLESLCIGDCVDMNVFEENKTEMINLLGNLRSVVIKDWKEMKSLPKWIQHEVSRDALHLGLSPPE